MTDQRRPRTGPLVYLWSGVLYDPDSEDRDLREWVAQSADGDLTCGGSFETFEEAQIAARLLAFREALGWTLEDSPQHMILSCPCGWSTLINGCYMTPLVPHFQSAHPLDWAVRG